MGCFEQNLEALGSGQSIFIIGFPFGFYVFDLNELESN